MSSILRTLSRQQVTREAWAWAQNQVASFLGRPGRLQEVRLRLTTRCNQRCRHCNMYLVHPYQELPKEVACGVVEQAARLGAYRLGLCGGEPLLYPHLLPLIELAVRCHMVVNINTNGTLLTREMAEALAARRVSRVSLALDGADAAAQDAMRGYEGAWQATKEAAYWAKAVGLTLGIVITLGPDNVQQYQCLWEAAQGLKADYLNVFFARPNIGMLAEERKATAPWNIEDRSRYATAIQEAVDFFLSAKKRTGYPATSSRLLRLSAAVIRGESIAYPPCSQGRGAVLVTADGVVRCCAKVGMPPLGSLHERTLLEIWPSQEAQAVRRLVSRGVCRPQCTQFASCFGEEDLRNSLRTAGPQYVEMLVSAWRRSRR